MGRMADFSKAFCSVHGRMFKEVSVCGLMIPCCQECTRPKIALKNKKKVFSSNINSYGIFKAKQKMSKELNDYSSYIKGIVTHRKRRKGAHRMSTLLLTHKKNMPITNILRTIKK